MSLVVSKSESSETVIDESSRGGIGSRLKIYDYDEVEEGGVLRGGLGTSSRGNMPTTEEMFAQREIPGRKGRKRGSEDDEGEMGRKPKKKGKHRAKVASD